MDSNISNITYPYDAQADQFFYSLQVYLVVSFSVISFLGTTGNGLVIWFGAFKMKKTVNSVWFMSLAMADLTFALFLPLRVTHLALNHWPFGDFMCKFHIFVPFLNLFASILHLTAISVDRCLCVLYPGWCQSKRTPRLAMKICLALWVLALAFSLPSFIFTEVEHYDSHVDCREDQFSKSGEHIQDHQVVIRFIIFFVAPFLIIVTCYTVIFLRIRRNHVVPLTKPFKVIAAVIVSFFVCWFPYHVFWLMTLNAIRYLQGHMALAFEIGFDVATSLAYANSCVNPFLYVLFGHDFKKKFYKSIKPTLERAFSEDSRLGESKRSEDSHSSVVNAALSQL